MSTGVDARNIRNIVLMRPVNQIIEFKQIIGRGTRLFDGKDFFTIYDFVDAYQRFFDPEWDGEPQEDPQDIDDDKQQPQAPIDDGNHISSTQEEEKKEKIKIKLKDEKEREIQYMMSTSFWSPDGNPISAQEFLKNLFGILPSLFKDEEELRQIWSNPTTRKTLLAQLDEAGFGNDALKNLQKLINAQNSDLFDVLEYVFNSDFKPITRQERAEKAKVLFFASLTDKQKEFIDFVLGNYIKVGVSELDQEKLPTLLQTKYQSLDDAKVVLGNAQNIGSLFIEFQKYLYDKKVA